MSDSERQLLREVTDSLQKAYELDPALRYPSADCAEILEHLGDGSSLDWVRSNALGPRSIGYRRGWVTVANLNPMRRMTTLHCVLPTRYDSPPTARPISHRTWRSNPRGRKYEKNGQSICLNETLHCQGRNPGMCLGDWWGVFCLELFERCCRQEGFARDSLFSRAKTRVGVGKYGDRSRPLPWALTTWIEPRSCRYLTPQDSGNGAAITRQIITQIESLPSCLCLRD
jgi:hypothetical protein